MFDVDWSVVDAHEQKYCDSCIFSAGEMILKLLRKVDVDYYEFQDWWKKNKSKKSIRDEPHKFDFFTDKSYFGSKLRCLGVNITFDMKSLAPKELFRKIDEELDSGRLVAIPVKNPGTCQEAGLHVWVVYGKKDGDYLSFSKGRQNTICFGQVHKRGIEYVISKRCGKTDILLYRT